MTSGETPVPASRPQGQGRGADGEGGDFSVAATARPPFYNRPWLRWLLVLVVVLVLAVLLAPWWGRPLLHDAVRSALLAEGWQTVELRVTHLGTTQATLSAIVLERPEARLQIPEIALRYGFFELLAQRRVQSVIVREPQMQAYFARSPGDLIGAPLLVNWPQGEHLPFARLYVSDAHITAQPSAGLQPLRLNALLEHTPPGAHSAGAAKLWLSGTSPAPYAQLEVAFEADLRERTLKATLDGAFRDLPVWRTLPLPPEALQALGVVREELALQGGVAVRGRTLQNWMLFGQSPAAVYTASDGTHVEALGVDFGLNVQGADQLDFGWLRAASGAASNAAGAIEWQNLRAELKPGNYLNAHIERASIRAELSSVARELMPTLRINNELTSLWRKTTWQATDLSANIFSPEPSKNRPAFMRLGARLQLGSLEYPWEKLEPLSPAFEAQLRTIPFLETLIRPAPAPPQSRPLLTLPR